MSAHKQKSFIKILNPVGSQTYTTLKKALSYVARSRATWSGDCIRLADSWVAICQIPHPAHKPHLASPESIERAKRLYRLRTMDEAGYDGLGQMTLDQIQGLPLAGPAIKLVQKGSRRFTPRAPRCKVLVA